MMVLSAAAATGAPAGPARPARPGRQSGTSERAQSLVAARLDLATGLGRRLADHVGDPAALATALRLALGKLADPDCRAGQQFVAPGIGATHGVRSPLLHALSRGFGGATRKDSADTLLLVADRLLREPELEAHWFAFDILARTLPRDRERTWQILRRASRDASDWITVDSLAHTVASGILAETYRWAELEQLVYSTSRWERRLVGSTIATIPFTNRSAGRSPEVARRGLELLAILIGDAEPDVQKALSWAYRSMALVDVRATAVALDAEGTRAAASSDGHRAWVIRDALGKIDPGEAERIRFRLEGIRRRSNAPATSEAAATAARFANLGLGQALAEPPLS